MKPSPHFRRSEDRDRIEGQITVTSILPVLRRKWKNLVKLGVVGSVIAVLFVAGFYLTRPTNMQATLAFRVLFSGVENGRYPNGVRFTPSDIVAHSVLHEVYQRHSLTNVVPFGDFIRCFAVLESNPGLNRLQNEYKDTLASRSLTPVERKRLEDEYADKVNALRNGEFALIALWDPKESKMPAKNMIVLMKDILKSWGTQANARGVFKFDMTIYSVNILPTISDAPDHLVATDRFRVATERVLRNVQELDKTPSARQVRVGPARTSLGELQSSLEDILKYRFSLMDAAVMRFGLYNNRWVSESYLTEQLLRLDTLGSELQNRLRATQEILRAYTSGRSGEIDIGKAPSVPANDRSLTNSSSATASFLDRIMDLSSRTEDMAFRQNLLRQAVELGDQLAGVDTEKRLYERRLKLLQSSTPELQGAVEAKTLVTSQLSTVAEELAKLIQNMQLIHEEISRVALRPEAAYTVLAEGAPHSRSVVNMQLIVVLVLGVWIIYFSICLLSVCWPVPARTTTDVERSPLQ